MACVKRWGIQKVTLNDIALEAGVTRPTVYSYFKDRDEVVQYGLLQSAYRYAEDALTHIEKFSTPGERILESMMYALNRLPEEPNLALMSDTGLAQIMNENALITTEGQEIRRVLYKIILKGTTYSDEELDEITEFTTRVMLSLLTVKGPKNRTDKEMRLFLSRRLLPAIGLESELFLQPKVVQQ